MTAREHASAARIYVASKSRHGPMWLEHRRRGEPICSTWIDECMPGQTKSWSGLYDRCVREASQCTALLLYQQFGEVLKGALLEAGAALAHGRPVFYLGPYDAKQLHVLHHPLVTVCNCSLEDAFRSARSVGSTHAR